MRRVEFHVRRLLVIGSDVVAATATTEVLMRFNPRLIESWAGIEEGTMFRTVSGAVYTVGLGVGAFEAMLARAEELRP